MRIEGEQNFGRERMRMPDRKYDDHSIGDHCPLNQFPKASKEAKDWWRQQRYAGVIGEQLKRVREFLALNPGNLDSVADFGVGTTFYPDEYPHGTITLVGKEADIYTTCRKRVLKKPYRSGLYEGPNLWLADNGPKVEWRDDGRWLEKEDYNDRRAFRGDNIGLVIRFPNTHHNQIMIINSSREQIKKGKTSLQFVEGGLVIGPWHHTVVEALDPMYLWHPEKKVYNQDDAFVHWTGVKIVEIGKGVREKARKPLEGLSRSVRRAFSST